MITRRLVMRGDARWLVLGVWLVAAGANARATDKTEAWIEVRSPHFAVATNGSEKQARRVADQFEQIRAVFQKEFPNVRVDPGEPILILAAKNEATLKTLLPEFWEKKGHTHPAGLFISGAEKNYVALRLDVSGENPYHVLYHEYTHLLVRLNYRQLPVWLNEGLAEFYGNTKIGEKELILGQPDASSIYRLRQNKLLPLEVLLKVDHTSPYYNEADKTSVFYAESWALVHYLSLDPRVRQAEPLKNFFRLLQNDTDELEAARQAFGDLKQLEKRLEAYAQQSAFYQVPIKSPSTVAEKEYVARPLPAAESAALRGDFHLYMRRTEEARALLEEALRLDPNLAAAHESMGLLHYRAGEREEAAKWFAQAVKLDSRSYLAHYFHAMLMVQGMRSPDSLAEVEASLRRATELNPNFAPAYATLAQFYSTREQTLEQAVAAARKAAELEPGDLHYYLNYGHVLLRTGHPADARVVGQRVLAAAKSPEVRAAAESFLRTVENYGQYQAQRNKDEEEARAAREKLKDYLRGDSRETPTSQTETPSGPAGGSPAAPATSPAAPAPSGVEGSPATPLKSGVSGAGAHRTPETRVEDTGAPKPEVNSGEGAASSPRRYSMFGRITEVSCATPPAMELTLSAGGITMRLHAKNYFKVEYLSGSWKPPANFNPCVHLKGLAAQASYTLVHGQPYDAEIISIEVRK